METKKIKKFSKIEKAIMLVAYRLENIAGVKIQKEILEVLRPKKRKTK